MRFRAAPWPRLSQIEGDGASQVPLLLALVALLHDDNPGPCSWACSATGHLVARGAAQPYAGYLVEQVIYRAEMATAVEVRLGAAIGLRQIVADGRLDAHDIRRTRKVLDGLAQDVSFRVRAAAIRR